MYTQFIQQYIKNNRLIYAEKVSAALAAAFGLDIKRASLITNNCLKRQCDADELHRVIKGVYCKKTITPFGPAVVQADEVIIAYLTDEHNGYITGPTFFNQIGLSTWMPIDTHVTSNRYSTKAKENKITLYKPVVEVTEQNKKYLQILDCIRDLNVFAVDAPDPEKVIYRYIVDNNLNFLKLILTAHGFYKDKVTKILLDIVGNQHVFA